MTFESPTHVRSLLSLSLFPSPLFPSPSLPLPPSLSLSFPLSLSPPSPSLCLSLPHSRLTGCALVVFKLSKLRKRNRNRGSTQRRVGLEAATVMPVSLKGKAVLGRERERERGEGGSERPILISGRDPCFTVVCRFDRFSGNLGLFFGNGRTTLPF